MFSFISFKYHVNVITVINVITATANRILEKTKNKADYPNTHRCKHKYVLFVYVTRLSFLDISIKKLFYKNLTDVEGIISPLTSNFVLVNVLKNG